MARKMTTAIPKSAFHVLGLEEADDLVLRAELMRKIGTIIEAKELTQAEAGQLIGMDQPRISALIRGKITKFSTDRLITALNDLGQNVELRIRPATQPKGVTKIIGMARNARTIPMLRPPIRTPGFTARVKARRRSCASGMG